MVQVVNRRTSARKILIAAALFGLVAGLVEGLGFISLQELDWLNARTGFVDFSIDIVWFSAVFNLLLFVIVGTALAGMARLLPKFPWFEISVFLFSLLAFLDWFTLALTGRFRMYAIVALALGLSVQFTRWFLKHQGLMWRFWRRSFIGIGLLVLLLMTVIAIGTRVNERRAVNQLPSAAPGSPNVVLIVVDALRADHLSSYGHSSSTSPNMDLIAQRGVLFENAFSASSWTLPSHASLLTGRFPFEHNAEWDNPTAVGDGNYPTLPEVLKSRGYRTAGFSGNLYWVTRRFGLDRGFIHFEDYFHSIGDLAARTIYGRAIESVLLRRLGFEDIPARRRASDINDSVVSWVEQDKERPFFVFINYMDVHDPYLPPQPHRSKFSSRDNPGGILNWRLGRSHPEMTPAQVQDEIDSYDGAISYVDDQIGRLVADLQKQGSIENTLFIITSDHGEMFGEQGLFLHGNSLYRGEIHVPLIIGGANKTPAGLRVDQPVSNTSVATTVMSLIGAEDQTVFPGPSLSRLWSGSPRDVAWPDPLSYLAQRAWVEERLPVQHGSIKSVIDSQWHYIEHEKLGAELYSVKQDPLEQNNLADSPDAQHIIKAFRSQLTNSAAPPSIGKVTQGREQVRH